MTEPEAFERAFIAASVLVGAEASVIESDLGEMTPEARALLGRLTRAASSRPRAAALAAELGQIARRIDRWRLT